ncbi:MAG TPA: hypothetical protein VII73_11350 [Caulobacteraceae bacterium]
MTLALPDILMGQFMALGSPLPPEAGEDYTAARRGMLAMLSALASQEAERGLAARLWENTALRTLFSEATIDYDASLDGRLAQAAAQRDADFTWDGLDAANANLRRLLIELHEAAEARADAALDRRIVDLYVRMAHERRLDLPGGLG